jgi:hypothetical protein
MKKGNIFIYLWQCLSTWWVNWSISSCSVDWIRRKFKFCVLESISVDVDAEELNDVFSSNGYAQVDTDDDNDEINIEDWDGDDTESIEEEEDNSNYFAKYENVMP